MKYRLLMAVGLALLLAGTALLPRDVAGSPSAGSFGGIRLVSAPSSPGKPGLFDSKSGLPIVRASTPLAPGHSVSGSVTITATGSAPQTVTVWQDHLVTNPFSAPDLASLATLTVTDTTTGNTVFRGTVEGFNTQARPLQLCGANTTRWSCPAWAPNESHVFGFTVAMPNIASENSYEGTSLTTDYEWSATPSGLNP